MASKEELVQLLNTLSTADTRFKSEWRRLRSYHSGSETYRLLSDLYQVREHASSAITRDLANITLSFQGGEPKAIDRVLDFIEIDIPAFRTGYRKEWYYKRLKRLQLNDAQISRLNSYALTLLELPEYRREWCELSRLLIVIADQKTLNKIHNLAATGASRQIRERARHTSDKIVNNRSDLWI